MKKYLSYIISALIALAVIVIDFISKIIAVKVLTFGDAIPVLGEFLKIELYFNTGMVFSFLENAPKFVLPLASFVMSILIGFMLFRYGDIKKRPIGTVALALMLGGAIGNMIDRTINFPAMLYTGYLPQGETNVGVVDFINTEWLFDILHMPNGVWNIADGCLVVGTIALAIHLIFLDKDDKKVKNQKEENQESSEITDINDESLEESDDVKND